MNSIQNMIKLEYKNYLTAKLIKQLVKYLLIK